MTKHDLVQFNTDFIIKSAAIYINPLFTYYLIKVAWGGYARVCARVAINLMLRGCQNIGEVLLRKFVGR
jgi:hypothetical protein